VAAQRRVDRQIYQTPASQFLLSLRALCQGGLYHDRFGGAADLGFSALRLFADTAFGAGPAAAGGRGAPGTDLAAHPFGQGGGAGRGRRGGRQPAAGGEGAAAGAGGRIERGGAAPAGKPLSGGTPRHFQAAGQPLRSRRRGTLRRLGAGYPHLL